MLFKVFKVFVLFSLGIVFASCPALDRIDFKVDTEGPKLLDVQDRLSQTGDWYALQFNEPIRLSAPPPKPISMATSTSTSNSYVECAVDVSNPSRLIIFLPDGPNTIAPMDTITFTIPEGYLTDEVDNPNAQTDSIIEVTGTSTETPHVFEQIIEDRTIPTFNDSVQDSDRPFIWSALKNYSGCEVHDVVYVTESGGGNNDGLSWDNAAAGSELDTKLKGLGASEPRKVSFLLVGVGTYSAKALKMKNNVAIVGGWKADGGWERPDAVTTIFDGGSDGSTVTDRVFDNTHVADAPLTDTALLHSVTVSNGNVDDGPGGGMYNMYASPTLIDVTFSNNTANNNSGGGMYNALSSPKLFNVKFLENSVTTGADAVPHNGGGMANSNSSPTLTNVTFSLNVATKNGGGMYNMGQSSPTLLNVKFLDNKADRGGGMNNNASAPTLINVTFSKNGATLFGGGMRNQGSSPLLVNATFSANKTTKNGGGMYNDDSSSPTLVNATFSANTANDYGGGMYNNASSPILINATFSANTANTSGGGMYNDNNGGDGPLVINSLFWANMGSSTTTNHQIFMHNDSSMGAENMALYNCIVQHGVDGAGGIGRTNDPNSGGDPIIITAKGTVTVEASVSLLSPLGENGGFVQTHALTGANSSAIGEGLYVMSTTDRTGWYYSENRSDWYSDLADLTADPTNTVGSPPADVIDHTATDARGYSRVDRPDIGAYEY